MQRSEIWDFRWTFCGLYSVLLEQCGSTRKRVNQLRSVDRALSRIHVLVLNDLWVRHEDDHCGGMFEQLARYTMRYQESADLHLGLILLILLTLPCTLSLTYFYHFYFSLLTISSIVVVLIAKAGHVLVSWPEEFLLYILSLTLQQVCYC